MSDAQTTAFVIASLATFIVVVGGVLFNNKRLDDMRDLLRAEMVKNHSELLMKFAEVDTRLARVEQQRLIQ